MFIDGGEGGGGEGGGAGGSGKDGGSEGGGGEDGGAGIGGTEGSGGYDGGNGYSARGRNCRILWPSATSTSIPLGVDAIPTGDVKVATSEPPSADPLAPLPATVVTAPLLTSTRRMILLSLSATYR